MAQYEQFSACLKRILEQENLSASQLAKDMNMRSRNSIFRILTDQVSVRLKEEFLQTLRTYYGDQWPQQHWKDLEQALEIEQLGLDDYLGRKALRYLIKADEPLPTMMLNIPRPHNGYSISELRPMLEKLFADGQLTISMCGCCSLPLCQLLADLLHDAGCQDRVYMRHYVNMAERTVVRNVVAIQPLLYFNWYDPLVVDPETCTEAMLQVYSAGTIFIEKTDETGKVSYTKYIMYDRDKLYRVSTEGRGISETIRLLNNFSDTLPKLRSVFPSGAEVEDYVRYTENYRDLEHDTEVLSIKPDVPINYVHPEILCPAAVDGFREVGFVPEGEDMEAIVEALYTVHASRYENFVKKRKVTHIVFSIDAMQQFMRTGKQTDHFFAQRPYTLAERLAILNHLREQSANNPYFSVYFLKPEYQHPTMEVTLYGGRGVLFTQFDTNYYLPKDHTESMVAHPMFEKKFHDFFIHELLPKYAMSQKESLNVMAQLAKDALKNG